MEFQCKPARNCALPNLALRDKGPVIIYREGGGGGGGGLVQYEIWLA